MTDTKPDLRIGSYLTKPEFFRLDVLCRVVKKAFGCSPYLVGSVLRRPNYHDVDLRMPMSEARGGTDLVVTDPLRLEFLNSAISEWLRSGTLLPIDFQFQTEAEWVLYDGQPRNPMGLRSAGPEPEAKRNTVPSKGLYGVLSRAYPAEPPPRIPASLVERGSVLRRIARGGSRNG